jgi:hypothetical protein
MAKKVAVLIKEKERQYEGLRTSLGLLMEFHIVSMIVLNHEIELTEEYKDNRDGRHPLQQCAGQCRQIRLYRR